MKLKAQIENERTMAEAHAHGWNKNSDDKRYYEGIIDALNWVLGSRNSTDFIVPIEDYKYLPNSRVMVDYTIFVEQGFSVKNTIEEAVATADYQKFVSLIEKENISYFAIGIDDRGGCHKATVNEDTLKNASHCVFIA